MARNQTAKKQNGAGAAAAAAAGGIKNKKKFVKGGVKKTLVAKAGLNVARKQVIGDARLKIIAKNRSKVVDARDKLASLAKKTDARQKLEKIRNFKEGKFDVKTTAKGGITITTTTAGALLLTTAKKTQKKNGQATTPQKKKSQPNQNQGLGINKQQGGQVGKKRIWTKSAAKGRRERNERSAPMSQSHNRQQTTSAHAQAHRGHSTLFKGERSPGRNDSRRHTPSAAASHYRESQRDDDIYRRQEPVYSGRTMAEMGGTYNSPLQGTKIIVTNLQNSVSQEDISELFGDVGPLKRAKVTSPGVAEVVYVNHSDALKSIEVYHNRQLDGKSMRCQIVGATPSTYPESRAASYSRNQGYGLDTLSPDVSVIHKALFDERRGRRY